MENSNIVQLIRAFSPIELREVRKFLRSPFFNQRQDLIDLFEYLVDTEQPDKRQASKRILEKEPPDDQKMRLLLSYLHRLLEQYLCVKKATENELSNQITVAKAYRQRGMAEAFERAFKRVSQSLEKQPLRNAFFHECRYQLHWEAHQQANTSNPNDISHLQSLTEEADIIYLTQKLRLICLSVAHGSVYQSSFQTNHEAEIIELATQQAQAGVTAITVYLNCYRMLRFPEEEVHFKAFKSVLLEQSGKFGVEEMHGLHILAINYCIRRLNAGAQQFYTEALELYKEGLAKEYLLENGILSRFTYHNVVAAGLQTGELDWVRFFINEYKNRLERRYRESSFSFNLARLEYAQRNYDFVLELLQKANYRDPLLNLAAKTLLLKTYFDLGEYDLLQSHLDAMRNYIHRKRVLGYHRTNYLNIIRFTEKLTRLNHADKKAVVELQSEVQKEKILTEKNFFLNILHVMQ